jgi:hypothetical protein
MLALPIGILIGLSVLSRPQWWALYFPFWYALFPKGFLLLDFSGIPVVTMYRFICIMLFVAMTVLETRRRSHWIKSCPLFLPLLLLFISAALSLLLNILSPDAGALQVFNLFNEIVVPVSAFNYYFAKLSKEEQHKYFRSLLLFYGVIAAYAAVTFLLDFNPYILFMESTTQTGRVQVQTYAETLRGLRAQGTISHPITFGAAIVLVLLASAAVSLDRRRIGRRIFSARWGVLCATFIIFAMMLTKSRSPIILLGIAGIYTVFTSSVVTSYIYIMIGSFLLALSYFFIPGVSDIVLSVVNIFIPSVGEAQHGSSLEMRQLQMAVALKYFLASPFAGNGLEATRNIVASGTEPDLYNSESLLFSVLINQGLVGLIVYIFLFIFLFVKVVKGVPGKNIRAVINGIVCGYLVFVLATGVMETLAIFLALMSALGLYYRPASSPISRDTPSPSENA